MAIRKVEDRHSTHIANVAKETISPQTKQVLRNYNRINSKNFPLFLKEYEFQFDFSISQSAVKKIKAVV